jgi:hypothetical protein
MAQHRPSIDDIDRTAQRGTHGGEIESLKVLQSPPCTAASEFRVKNFENALAAAAALGTIRLGLTAGGDELLDHPGIRLSLNLLTGM